MEIAPLDAIPGKMAGNENGGSGVSLINGETQTRIDEVQNGEITSNESAVDTYRDRVTYLWGDKYGKSAQLNDYLKKSAT